MPALGQEETVVELGLTVSKSAEADGGVLGKSGLLCAAH